MEMGQTRSQPKGIISYVLVYLAWLVTGVVSFLTMTRLRSTLNNVWSTVGVVTDTPTYAIKRSLHLADTVFVIIGFIAWSAYIFYAEGIYRKAIEATELKRMGEKHLEEDEKDSEDRGTIEELGLDLLLRRFLATIAIPIGIFLFQLAIQELVLWLIQ